MIFLDSSDIHKIQYFVELGIVQGVTTNPTILRKDGITDSGRALGQIADWIFPRPISIELTNNDRTDMMNEAISLRGELGTNVNIKVPIHGPSGETDNLAVIKELEESYNIRVNVTACMNAQQLMLASMIGATYVSLFGGRVADMGADPITEIKSYKALKLSAKLILGSVREVKNVIDWLIAGADIVTVPPDILEKMIYHPRTAETVQQFLEDANEHSK